MRLDSEVDANFLDSFGWANLARLLDGISISIKLASNDFLLSFDYLLLHVCFLG